MTERTAPATGPMARVLALLPDAKPNGNGWLARCPAHNDRSPSLKVDTGKEGQVLLDCKAGCPFAAVVGALGLQVRELFPEREVPITHGTNGHTGTGGKKAARELRARYPYTDAEGRVLFEVLRYEPKDFRQRRPDGMGGWVHNLEGVPPVLFALPDVIRAVAAGERVYVVEGEKDAMRLIAHGLVATTNAGGVGGGKRWEEGLAEYFRGAADVVLVPDNDAPGRKHADRVAAALTAVGAAVRIVALPVPAKGDVSDWLASGGTLTALEPLIASTPYVRAVRPAPAEAAPADPAEGGGELTAAERRRRVVEEMNRTYAMVRLGGNVRIMREDRDPSTGQAVLRFERLDAFRDWLTNKRSWLNGVATLHSTIWLSSPDRRTYEGVVFEPRAGAPEGYYNLWQGFALTPDPRGAEGCPRFLRHMADVIAGGDPEIFTWVMGWWAQMIQDPEHPPGTSLVLRGPQGAGKTLVGQMFGRLLGAHYGLVSDAALVTGRFNSLSKNYLLLQLDEATWGGDHEATGKLKDLITGRTRVIEEKGQEPYVVQNYLRLLVTSNNEWVVPASWGERRFTVLDVGGERMQDTAYFAALRAEMDTGGAACLLHYLQTYDLDGINLRQALETEALHDQQLASMTPEQSWLYDVLAAGVLPGDRTGDGEAPARLIRDDYLEHAHKAWRHYSREQFGRFLRRMIPGVLRPQRATGPGGTSREWCYSFPALTASRRAFEKAVHSVPDWPQEVAEWTPDAEHAAR